MKKKLVSALTGTTFVPPSHDRVTQRQRCEELRAERTLLFSELLHQVGSRHVQTTAREGIPAQVHGLHAYREREGPANITGGDIIQCCVCG